ncbi:CDP-alcohol phosphatidyltransferase family protein [Haliangium sp.]|uniref:CDP-alcohol phosphatidyltransferase family protein n=1 Tax=Haliangium sp. TaxID=2663208 RepID=UPI003D0B7F0E
MERFYVIAPALIPSIYMIAAFVYFCVLSAKGRRPQVAGLERRRFTEIFGPFLTGYFLWLIQPIERFFVAVRVPPNAITLTSMLLCAGAGVAAATGYLTTAAWVYIGAGMLDILDGRLARATGRSSRAGAFLDSVSDRWGELFVLTGYAWLLRGSPWLLAVMLVLGSSLMVSYTRARGEGLGLSLDGGTMQRAERIALVSVGTMAAAWLQAATETAAYGVHVIGVVMAVTGLGSAATSLSRWRQGYRVLAERERLAGEAAGPAAVDAEDAAAEASDDAEAAEDAAAEAAGRPTQEPELRLAARGDEPADSRAPVVVPAAHQHHQGAPKSAPVRGMMRRLSNR